MRRLIGLLFLLPSLAFAQAPWPGQCPSDAPGSALGCFPQAATPLATDLVFSWQAGQTPETRALQVQQIFNAGLPASFTSLTVTGNATVGGTLHVIGATTLAAATLASLTVTGATTLNTLSVTGAATLASLGVTGATTLNTLNVTGSSVLASLSVTGASTMSGPTNVNNTLNVTQSGNGPSGSLFRTTYNLNAAATSSTFNPTENLFNITATLAGHEIWTNFDSIVYNVAGGDPSAATNLVGRYIGLQRLTDAPNVPLSGLIVGFVDFTNHAGTVSGGYQAIELDMEMNGDGTGANNRRAMLINLSRHNPAGADPSAEVALDIQGGPGWNSVGYTKILNLESYFHDAGIDFRFGGVVAGGSSNAIWLKTGMKVALDTAGSFDIHYDPALLTGSGATRLSSSLQVDGTLYVPNAVIVGGATSFTDGATFSGNFTTIDGNGKFALTTQTNQVGANVATLTNAPAAGGTGNPKFWVPIVINGALGAFPVWQP